MRLGLKTDGDPEDRGQVPSSNQSGYGSEEGSSGCQSHGVVCEGDRCVDLPHLPQVRRCNGGDRGGHGAHLDGVALVESEIVLVVVVFLVLGLVPAEGESACPGGVRRHAGSRRRGEPEEGSPSCVACGREIGFGISDRRGELTVGQVGSGSGRGVSCAVESGSPLAFLSESPLGVSAGKFAVGRESLVSGENGDDRGVNVGERSVVHTLENTSHVFDAVPAVSRCAVAVSSSGLGEAHGGLVSEVSSIDEDVCSHSNLDIDLVSVGIGPHSFRLGRGPGTGGQFLEDGVVETIFACARDLHLDVVVLDGRSSRLQFVPLRSRRHSEYNLYI